MKFKKDKFIKKHKTTDKVTPVIIMNAVGTDFTARFIDDMDGVARMAAVLKLIDCVHDSLNINDELIFLEMLNESFVRLIKKSSDEVHQLPF